MMNINPSITNPAIQHHSTTAPALPVPATPAARVTDIAHATQVMNDKAASLEGHLNLRGREMQGRLQTYFHPHRATAGSQEENNRDNAELGLITNDRALRLQQKGYGLAHMEKAEKNAKNVDLMLTTIRATMGGSPFSGLTLATNLHPDTLNHNPQDTPLKDIALQNVLASLYASAADVGSNPLLKGFRPEETLNPGAENVHPSLAASRAAITAAHDKGALMSAAMELAKWGGTFMARNTAVFGVRVGLESTGKAKLATDIEDILRPLTAVIAGVAIAHYDQYLDRQRGIAGPAMLYGRRDPVPEGSAPKDIEQDEEWLKTFESLQTMDWLFSKDTLTDVSDRAGKGVAGFANAALKGEVFSELGQLHNQAAAGALAASFAAYGVAPAALRQLMSAHNFSPAQIVAAADGLKEVLGAAAFGIWAFVDKLVAAITSNLNKSVNENDQVAKGVTKGLNTGGRAVAAMASKGANVVVDVTQASRRGLQRTGDFIADNSRSAGSAMSSGVGTAANYTGQQLQSLRNRFGRPNNSNAAPTQNIPMTTLQPSNPGQAATSGPVQPSSSAPPATDQPRGDDAV
ncbi:MULTISPECIES: hypothetical protein [Pseudomonas]|uniref:Uncharacterized protein n=1 Tax=Pseudomonas quercus TaxID=2722792 RepID=A0ABX0YJR9_9PSED|nr:MULTISPECIES: hypothetical protein [Pseudomonas]MBF7144709.1 hypothetical protein [Pseudomonas sp. LY10J]NJP03246.1 hypothetical protein [Pseudomonas quercus]